MSLDQRFSERTTVWMVTRDSWCVCVSAHHDGAGRDRHHVRSEASSEDVCGLHLLLRSHRLPADQRVHQSAQTSSRGNHVTQTRAHTHTMYNITYEWALLPLPAWTCRHPRSQRGSQKKRAASCVHQSVLCFQILVHGEQNEMARLKAALIREYEDNDEVDIEVHNPRNTEAVTLNFRGEKLAKVWSEVL